MIEEEKDESSKSLNHSGEDEDGGMEELLNLIGASDSEEEGDKLENEDYKKKREKE